VTRRPEPQLVEAWHAMTGGLRPAIIQGHVLDVLRDLPAEAFQAVVTSPPYWGLRLYGTDPQVWGGRVGHGSARSSPTGTPRRASSRAAGPVTTALEA